MRYPVETCLITALAAILLVAAIMTTIALGDQ